MSGTVRKVSGSLIGTTGVAISVRTVGFRPSRVEVYNVTGVCHGMWQNTMADASMFKTVDSGAGETDLSLVSSDGITPLADGFTFGADGDLNVDAEVVHWTAFD